MNALELADKLEADKFYISNVTLQSAAVELRRLYEVNQELLEALKWIANVNAMDAEYQIVARAAINKAEGKA